MGEKRMYRKTQTYRINGNCIAKVKTEGIYDSERLERALEQVVVELGGCDADISIVTDEVPVPKPDSDEFSLSKLAI